MIHFSEKVAIAGHEDQELEVDFNCVLKKIGSKWLPGAGLESRREARITQIPLLRSSAVRLYTPKAGIAAFSGLETK